MRMLFHGRDGMGKKRRAFWEKWSYALLCMLCAGVILCSALWTRNAQEKENAAHPSGQSMDEKLEDALLREQENRFLRPCAGKILRSYSEQMLFFEQTQVWRTHMGVDLQAAAGVEILAMGSGTVLETGEGYAVQTCGDKVCTYWGLSVLLCETGQNLSAGDAVGLSGGHVPFEGSGHVCIRVQDASGAYQNPALLWETE